MTVFKINLLECLQADVYFVYVCDMYIYKDNRNKQKRLLPNHLLIPGILVTLMYFR